MNINNNIPDEWCLRLLQWGGRGEGGAQGIVWGWTTRPPRPLIGPHSLKLAADLGWQHTQVWSVMTEWWCDDWSLLYFLQLSGLSPHLPHAALLGLVFLSGVSLASQTRGQCNNLIMVILISQTSKNAKEGSQFWRVLLLVIPSIKLCWLTLPSMQEEEEGRPTRRFTTSLTPSPSSWEPCPTTPSGSATPSPSPARPRTSRDTR